MCFLKVSYSLKGGTEVLSALLSKGPWSGSCDGVEEFYGEVMVRGDLDMALCQMRNVSCLSGLGT